MQKMVTVTALTSFEADGRMVSRGDAVEMAPAYAAAAARRGDVTLTVGATVSRQAVKTRDMQAVDPPALPSRSRRQRKKDRDDARRYERRDLEAKE